MPRKTEAPVPRKHAVGIALLVAGSTAFGLFGLAQTLHLGAAASAVRAVPNSVIVKRSHTLDRFEIALKRQLDRRPPKLPPIPKVHKPPVPPPAPAASAAPVAAAPAPAAAPPQAVRYVRPPPVVVTVHHSHGDDGGDHEGGDGGGGGDSGD